MKKGDKVIIASDGHRTDIMINGKLYGDGILKVEFSHDNTGKYEEVKLILTTDSVPIPERCQEERDDFLCRLREFSKREGLKLNIQEHQICEFE